MSTIYLKNRSTGKMAVLPRARRSSLVRLRTVGINQLRAFFLVVASTPGLWGAQAASLPSSAACRRDRVRQAAEHRRQAACAPRKRSTGTMPVSLTAKMAALLLFPLGAAEQRQDEQVCQDINGTSGEHDQTEALRRWKIGQHENGKTSGDDYVGIDNATPLFLACFHPGVPVFLSIALRAANPEDKMDHRVDRDPDADIASRRRNHVHRDAQPTDPAKHTER